MGFLSSIGDAISGAVGDLVGGVAGSVLNSYQDKSYYNYAMNKDIKLWQMQNEYNTPKAQMERYREASLNPNLIYGQSNASDSVGRSSLSQQSDILGQGSKLANNRVARMAQYQGILSNQAAIDETNARVEQIHNNIKIANKMLPYQQKALEMQIKNTAAGLTSPTWLSQFVGKDNASAFSDFISNLFGVKK